MDKQRSRQIRNQISEILWEKWDPIGVNCDARARDEYDSYVGSVFNLLTQGYSDEQLSALLLQHETINMGLHGSSRKYLLAVVEALRLIDVEDQSSRHE